ncbi:MAG: SPOR domain-containing protein [Spirochaetia bacterium]|nr:SPOR domain-containing protein [Spirochaetia bacterium]
MSSENIKKVYVVNLNKSRVVILTGTFIFLMSLTFLAGVKWVKTEPVENTNPLQLPRELSRGDHMEDPPEIPATPLNSPKSIADLPEEDNRMFEKNSRDKEDPFLNAPQEKNVFEKSKGIKSVSSKEQKSRVEKKNVNREDKIEKEEVSSQKSEKYFSVQIGAFVHEKDANSLKARLIEKKMDARVEKGSQYYYVRAGKAKNKKNLDTMIKKIHDRLNIQAIVVQNKAP